MKYKDLIKKLEPHADEEVIIFANYFEGYDEVAFYPTEDGEPFCVISQVDGKKAKFQKTTKGTNVTNQKKLKMETNIIYCEDCRDTMAKMDDNSVDLVVTSPPYNKSRRQSYSEQSLATRQGHYKDFDDAKSNAEYIEWTLARFREFGRILADDGVVAYNLSYATDEVRMSELMWLVVAEIIKQGIFTIADTIVWKKKSAVPNNVSANKLTRICEFIFIFVKRGSFDTFHANKRVLSVSKTGQKIYEPFYNFIAAENNDGVCEIHKATYSTNMCVQVLDRYGVRGGVCL